MDKKNFLILFLIVIIIILIGFLSYNYYIKQKINNYFTERDNSVKEFILYSIVKQISEDGYLRITDGNGNSLVLVPYQNQINESINQTE